MIENDMPLIRDVFILGAGFSRAISREMPLTKELLHRISSEKPALREETRRLLERDFEIGLSFLSQSQAWLSEAENLRNRADFLEISNDLSIVFRLASSAALAALDYRDETHWFHRLLRKWHDAGPRPTIITLNYDCLVEYRAKELKLTEPFEIQNLYQLPLATASGGKPPKPAKTFRLFKLHGSMNWLYSGRRSFGGETLVLGDLSTDEVGEGYFGIEAPLRGKYSLIIPPVLDKGVYMQHEGLVAQWRQAAYQIANATRVFCLGYSLPPSDLSMVNFLRRTGMPKNSSPDLWVVDIDAAVAVRYEKLLDGCYRSFHRDFSGTGDALPRFCEWYLQP